MAKEAKSAFADFDMTKFMDPSKFMDVSKFMDPSKFMDMTKVMGDFKVPGFNAEGLMAAQRKNIEAMTAANQLAVEGLQAVMRRQAEIVRQSLEEAGSTLSDMMAAGTPEDKVAKQVELVKAQFEKTMSNIKELSEMVAKSNTEAAEVLSARVTESIEEMKSVIGQAMPKK